MGRYIIVTTFFNMTIKVSYVGTFLSLILMLSSSLLKASDLPSGSTVCVLPTGARYTNMTDCSDGEVYLIGQYVNLGIHHVASFGTESSMESSYYNGQLGFIADFDRNGFSSSPPAYAGDYFVPGTPLEGD